MIDDLRSLLGSNIIINNYRVIDENIREKTQFEFMYSVRDKANEPLLYIMLTGFVKDYDFLDIFFKTDDIKIREEILYVSKILKDDFYQRAEIKIEKDRKEYKETMAAMEEIAKNFLMKKILIKYWRYSHKQRELNKALFFYYNHPDNTN